MDERNMAVIDRINDAASRNTIGGWFIGLAYFTWFGEPPISLPIWVHLLLIVGGMFVASIVIGGGLALLVGGVVKLLAGRSDAQPAAFGLVNWIAPVIAFFAAKYALAFARGFF